jgi:hypothetical protein
MTDEYMKRMEKEQRAQEFLSRRSFAHVPIVPEDEFSHVLGDCLANGSTREVHSVVGRDDVVIKKVKAITPFNNWQEFIVWNAVRDTRWAVVFARIEKIGDSGQFLMMEKLSDLSPDDDYNAPRVPHWLNDLKRENFGKTSGGEIKAWDYALVNLGFDLDEALDDPVPWRKSRSFSR